jgi:large subunit ribosomal protein L4
MSKVQKGTKIDVLDTAGNKLKEHELDASLFDVPLRPDVLHQVVVWQLAKRRTGWHDSKTRGEVSGSNRKIRPQKGSGRARAGSLRPPHFKGGGVAFGPHSRDHEHKVNKKVKKSGLRVAISDRVRNQRVVMVDGLSSLQKTAQLQELLQKICPASKKALIVGETSVKSAANLIQADYLAVAGLNVYDILRSDLIVVDASCIGAFTERLV